MSNRSDANMEHSDSQGSNDTIKITPQFAPHVKPKVYESFILLHYNWPVEFSFVGVNMNYITKSNIITSCFEPTFFLFLQGDPLRTLPLSLGGSVESLPARTQCLAPSDSKRMSADLSELEHKVPFAPAGNTRHYTVPQNTLKQSWRGGNQGNLICPLPTQMKLDNKLASVLKIYWVLRDIALHTIYCVLTNTSMYKYVSLCEVFSDTHPGKNVITALGLNNRSIWELITGTYIRKRNV